MIHDEIPLFILDNNTDYCFYPRMWTYMPKLMEKSCPLPFPQTMPSIRLVSARHCETLHGYFPQNRSRNSPLMKRWSSRLDRQSHCNQVWQCQLCDDGKEIWQKVCYMFRVFICLLIRRCFFIFFFPSLSLWLLELTLPLCYVGLRYHAKEFSLISLQNRQFDGKHQWKLTPQVPIQRLYSLTHEILYNHPKTCVMNVNQLPWEFTHDYTVTILMCLWNGHIFYAGILICLYCL